RNHKFYLRLDSPLHLPNEEPVLVYLKFSAKGTKREFFRMPIPGNLITSDIQDLSAVIMSLIMSLKCEHGVVN
nr:hypothetical protein [Tanacetum cinerariifolium]